LLLLLRLGVCPKIKGARVGPRAYNGASA
jgi:hypothetical protein